MKQITDMLELIVDGAMPADEHGTVVLWNKAAEHLPGFLAQDVIGRPFCWAGVSIGLGRQRKPD